MALALDWLRAWLWGPPRPALSSPPPPPPPPRCWATSAQCGGKGAHRKVLIDLGANCGDTYLEMQQMFPALQASNAEIYLWEPLPVLLDAYLRHIASIDPRVRLVESAAWVSEGTTQFFQSKRDEKLSASQVANAFRCNDSSLRRGNPHGAATMVDAKSHWNRFLRKGEPVQVGMRDFARWYAALKLAACDYVVLKIDIEGAEHAVLQSLLGQSQACEVDEWLVEWHPNSTNTTHALPKLRDTIRRCSAQSGCPVHLREQVGPEWRLVQLQESRWEV